MSWKFGGWAIGPPSIHYMTVRTSPYPCEFLSRCFRAGLTLHDSYLGFYCVIVLGVVLLNTYGVVVYTVGSMRASRIIHQKLMHALLGSTFRCVRYNGAYKTLTINLP